MLIFDSVTLLSLSGLTGFFSVCFVLVQSVGFCAYKLRSSANIDNLTSFLLIWMPVIYLLIHPFLYLTFFVWLLSLGNFSTILRMLEWKSSKAQEQMAVKEELTTMLSNLKKKRRAREHFQIYFVRPKLLWYQSWMKTLPGN